MLEIKNCPGTLREGYKTYNSTALRRVFMGRKVHHVLAYNSPAEGSNTKDFIENQQGLSISGVQEKFSILQVKNQLRLVQEGEQGTHILKPIPNVGENSDQMPANEHLTMQIAYQVYGIETAENAIIFFQNNEIAYITKRFDVKDDGLSKWAKEDFASLAGKSPQTHGEHYKYLGNYLELFQLLKKYVTTYMIEAQKLFERILFNYLFSNGDAHIKNFSLLETAMGDFRLSPVYDLLNTRLHIDDTDFALKEGLLPKAISKGKILTQFQELAKQASISEKQSEKIIAKLLSKELQVKELIKTSFLSEKAKRNYLQAYQTRLKKLLRK